MGSESGFAQKVDKSDNCRVKIVCIPRLLYMAFCKSLPVKNHEIQQRHGKLRFVTTVYYFPSRVNQHNAQRAISANNYFNLFDSCQTHVWIEGQDATKPLIEGQ